MLQFLRCLGSGFVFSSGARAVCLRIKGFKVARVVLTRFESDVEKMEIGSSYARKLTWKLRNLLTGFS